VTIKLEADNAIADSPQLLDVDKHRFIARQATPILDPKRQLASDAKFQDLILHQITMLCRSSAKADLHIATEVITKDDYGIHDIRHRLARRPKYIVDIGAHIGSFSLYMSKMFNETAIIAYELSSENCFIFANNIAQNKVQNVWVENAAIIGRELPVGVRSQEFMQEGANTGGSRLIFANNVLDNVENGEAELQNFKASFKKFSSIFERPAQKFEGSIDQIDILKMDCEGAEYQILQTAAEERLLERVNYLILELHVSPEKDRHFHQIFKYLESFDYVTVRKVSPSKSSRIIHAWRI